MKSTIIILVFSLFINYAKAQELMQTLKAKFGNDNVEMKDSSIFKEFYLIKFRQPIDHKDTGKGFFYQRIILGHDDFKKPMVLVTDGYELRPLQRSLKYKAEPTELLYANQIFVEHRYFGESIPDSVDKTWLNMEQAAADYHNIKTSFSALYKNYWISTGASKGGHATLNYRFYYPNDTEASIAYVAPVLKSDEDKRLKVFLDEKRKTDTGQIIFEIQKHLLKNKQSLMPVVGEILQKDGLSLGDIDLETLYDYTVLEFDFNYWQYISGFKKLLDLNKDVLETMNKNGLQHSDALVSRNDSMVAVFPAFIWWMLDKKLADPFFYQCFTELGSYGYEEELFNGLKHKTYSLEFLAGKHPKYTSTYSNALNRFIEQDLTKTIFIYGGNDPWTSCAVTITPGSDNLVIINPNTNHQTQMHDVSTENKYLISRKLSKWLSTEVIVK